MDVRCERCGTQYVLEDARIAPGGAAVRCTNCGNVFTVYPPQPVQAPPPTPARVPTPTFGVPAPMPPPVPVAAMPPPPVPATPAAPPRPLSRSEVLTPALGSRAPAPVQGRPGDPVDAFETSFGVQPGPEDRGRRSALTPMSPQEIEEDVETLRKSGRFRYALGAAGLLVAAVLVVYLLGRPTFDKLLGSKPRTPEAAAAKLAQARAAARLDTVAGYQQSVALAKEAVRLAGEIPYARAQAQIALADVGWADLLQARASQHQMLADGIQTTFDSTPPPGPSCCPQDEQARAGLEACKGRRPTLCTADEEIARAKALEEFEETTQKHAATVEAQERAKTAAIRDRADARVRLDDALSAARKARALDPEEVMADVAFVAYDRASGDQKAMDKVVAKIGTEHKGESIPELAREEALATDEAHKLAALEKLAGTQGDDARIHFALASQLDGHGDSDRAHAEAEKTVALSAEHEAARQLLRVLDQRARHNPPPAAVPASADPAPPKGLAQERGRE